RRPGCPRPGGAAGPGSPRRRRPGPPRPDHPPRRGSSATSERGGSEVAVPRRRPRPPRSGRSSRNGRRRGPDRSRISRMRGAGMTLVSALLAAVLGGPAGPQQQPPQPAPQLPPLRVSDNGRYLVHDDGTPFFWLADTAWSIFVNLDRAEVERYLDARAEQGFTVIQAVAVFPQAGGPGPNRYGHHPLSAGLTPAVAPGPDDDYWDHVDFVVAAAAARGLRIGLLPVWADNQVGKLVTTSSARAYGEFLGARYGRNVVWIMGGDHGADGAEDVWRRLAEGVAVGANGAVDHTGLLMTYHPRGDQTSAEWFHDDEWLSFNMLQGGHCRRWDKLLGLIEGNWARRP